LFSKKAKEMRAIPQKVSDYCCFHSVFVLPLRLNLSIFRFPPKVFILPKVVTADKNALPLPLTGQRVEGGPMLPTGQTVDP